VGIGLTALRLRGRQRGIPRNQREAGDDREADRHDDLYIFQHSKVLRVSDLINRAKEIRPRPEDPPLTLSMRTATCLRLKIVDPDLLGVFR
jgi:hypothetical protein